MADWLSDLTPGGFLGSPSWESAHWRGFISDLAAPRDPARRTRKMSLGNRSCRTSCLPRVTPRKLKGWMESRRGRDRTAVFVLGQSGKEEHEGAAEAPEASSGSLRVSNGGR